MTEKRTPREWMAIGVVVTLTPLSIFYLFVLPVLIAGDLAAASLGNMLFGAFLYLQLWMLAIEYTYSAVADLYGFKRRSLIGGLFLRRFGDQPRPTSRADTAVRALLSYGLTIYGFAAAYIALSAYNPAAFCCERLRLPSALYFSLVTIATVGFGDITPKSSVARAIVSGEILIGVIYAVFLFSLLSSFLRARARQE